MIRDQLAALPAQYLHELAHIADRREHAWRLELSDDALQDMADRYQNDQGVGFGWWKTHTPPPDPPRHSPAGSSSRQWTETELTQAALDMAAKGIGEDVTVDVLAALADAHGLPVQAATQALVAYLNWS